MPQFAPQNRAPEVKAQCVPAAEFRNALSRLATTVSVITTDGPAGAAGVTCSAVCALSDEPPMVLVCIHGKSATNAAIKANRVFCVNSLQADQRNLSQAFAGIGSIPMKERFMLTDWDALVTGAPRCKHALVTLDCEVAEVRDVGTHSVFTARVLATKESEAGEPLLYQRRAYATTRLL
jgi:flavin reductase (NADH)/flavin reductase/chlorophenol-4-monooxygenase component 1